MRSRTSPSLGAGTGVSSLRKSPGFGIPSGRAARRIRLFVRAAMDFPLEMNLGRPSLPLRPGARQPSVEQWRWQPALSSAGNPWEMGASDHGSRG